MLELRHFRYFIAVAEERHFGRAAARLFMTQPPLSMQIRQLEEVVGVPLILRDSRPITLTAAGEAFLLQAREVIRQADSAVQRAQLTARGEAGHLTIAVTSASVLSLLPRLIATFKQRYPAVQVDVRELVSREQVDALVQSDINLGLVRPPIDLTILDMMPIQAEPIVVAIPRRHPLADFARIPVEELHRTAFIRFDPISAAYFYRLAESLFHSHNIQPLTVQTATQLHTVMALVSSGLGLALVPEAAARIQLEDVVLRPLALDPPPMAELCLAWNRNDSNPAIVSFLELLREEWAITSNP